MLPLMPVLTGFLLIASFPRFNQPWLAWIAFIPLIAFMVRVRTPARAFWGGYVAGGIELFALLVWMPAVLGRYGGLSDWLAWTGYFWSVGVLEYWSIGNYLLHDSMTPLFHDYLFLPIQPFSRFFDDFSTG